MHPTQLERSLTFSIVRSTKAVAALEFGILAPVMALLVVGVFNLAKMTILWEQVWSASRSIAESATTLAIQPDGSAQLSVSQINLALSEVYAQIPWVAAGIATGPYTGTGQNAANTVTAVLSSISYTPSANCAPSSCNYQAVVLWSEAYAPAGFVGFNTSAFRPCTTLTGTNVPTTIVNQANYANDTTSVADPFVIADVSVVYTPFLFSVITGSVTLSATSYVPIRSNQPGAQQANMAASLTDPQDIPAQTGCPSGGTPS